MLLTFTNGIFSALDVLLAGWALGLLWLAGCALRLQGGVQQKLASFLQQEKYLFGNWGGEFRHQAGDWMFLSGVVATQITAFFLNSLVRENTGTWYTLLLQATEFLYLWVLLLKIVFFTRYSGQQLIVGFCFFFVFRWVFINNHAFWMGLGLFCILAAKDADLRRTVKAGLVASILCFAAVAGGSIVGWIPTLQTGAAESNSRLRDSFGYGWYNMTGAVLLAICLMYLCWRQVKHLKWFDFVLLGSVLVFCNQGPDSRAATTCIAILILLAAVLRLWPQMIQPVWIRALAAAIPAAAFFVSLLGSWLYEDDNPVLHAVNTLLSGRLLLGQQALQQTSIAIAGQGLWDKNFIVDNYYVYLWIYGGPVASLLLWGAVTWLLWRLMKKRAAAESICLVVMLAHATMEGHFIWPCINVCLWLLPCVVYLLPQDRTPDFANPITDAEK